MAGGTARGWLRDVLGLGLAYFVTGKLGLLLAIPPGYATAIWPPSGIALAALLLRGTSVWPGVLLGSFAVNAGVGLDASSRPALVRSVMLAIAIGCGASLQAVVGERLIRRVLGFPHPLEEGRDVVRFLALGGPCACLTNALCSSSILLAAGSFPASRWATNALTWWAGDVLGVVVIVPIVLCFLATPRDVWRSRRASVALPMAIVFALAVALFVRGSELEERQIQREFREHAAALARGLERNIDSQLLVLQSIRDYFGASERVTRKEFASYVTPALERAPGVLALEWVPRVTRAERDALEAATEAEGLSGFQIREGYGTNETRRAGERETYYPVLYAEPRSRVAAALGLDVGSEPTRRLALERARDRAEPTASARIVLQLPGRAGGVLVFVPMYWSEVVPATVEARRSELRGFALGVFRIDEWVAAAFEQTPRRGIGARIDDESEDGARELYSEAGALATGPRQLRWSTVYEFAGRHWRLSFAALESYAGDHTTWHAPALLGAVLLFCGMLGAFLLVVSGRTAELERRSEQSSKMLATIVQSSEDAILAYDRGRRVISWNSGAVRCFGWQESEVLGGDSSLFVPAEDLAEHERKLDAVLAGSVPESYEAARLTRDGRRLDVSVRLSAIPDAAGSVRGVSAICRDISAQKENDRRLRASLREKEVLLKEVHHRVKNNLQVISSLLHLQSNHLSPDLRAVFDESQTRIQSIALVHEKLYQSKDLNHVDFADYIQTLVRTLFRAQGSADGRIAPQIDVNSVQLPVDMAIPCGLLIGELVTNALKHAFPGDRTGTIHVTLRNGAGNRVQLTVADDGVGLPPDFDPRRTTSLGLDLVYTFAEQLHAEVELQRGGGTAFMFSFCV